MIAIALAGCNAASPTEPVATAPQSTVIRPAIATPNTTIDPRARAALGESDRIDQSPVPVLAPADPFESPVVMVGPEYYAISLHAGSATIAIQGTRAQHRVEGVGPIAGDRTLRSTRGFVTMNEGIRTASWMEHGAAYSVDVECADRADARCTGDAFVVSLVNALVFVGGGPR
jgi:hypothetical protein